MELLEICKQNPALKTFKNTLKNSEDDFNERFFYEKHISITETGVFIIKHHQWLIPINL